MTGGGIGLWGDGGEGMVRENRLCISGTDTVESCVLEEKWWKRGERQGR